MLWGQARVAAGADKMNLKIWEETVPDPGASVALRAVNTTGAAVEVRVYTQGGTVPAAADWTIPAYTASTYILKAPGNYMYNVQPAGGGATLFADALALPGGAGDIDLEAFPGTTIAGSAVSAFIFPKSTAGSRAAQFAAPGVTFNWDRRPPRACSPLC
jgi:hypothetical protein